MSQESRRPRIAWCTIFLMVVLTGSFAVQQIVVVHMEKPYDAYLALSGYGMKSGHLWELFTYQFFHAGWIHWAVNLAGLWVVGRPVEISLGAKRFAFVYVAAVLVGAVAQAGVALAGFYLPESMESLAAILRERFGGPVYGASVGLCGVFAAFCLAQPDRRLFSSPLKFVHLCWGFLVLAVALLLVPSNPTLAHVSHMAGFLLGWISMKWARSRCWILAGQRQFPA